jgi:hypothetical protein
MAALATVSKLKILVKKPELPASDPYAQMMLDQATRAVRFEGKPASLYWSLEPDEDLDQVEVPEDVVDIVLWVAARAFLNPRNLERRTAGPVSETFRDVGIYGLELTDQEKQRVADLAAGDNSHSRGLWTQPVGAGKLTEPIYLTDSWPGADLFLVADGTPSQAWPWGG